MKKIIISLIIPLLLLSGCYNYRDIDTVEFVTDFIIDMDENNKIIIYIRAYKGIRSTNVTEESSEILMFKEEGETIFEAIRNIALFSSSRLDYSQIKAVIMTERAAKKGIDLFVNFLERDQELNLRTRLFIFRGDPKELINLKLRQAQFLGLYLWDVLKNSKAASKTVNVSLNDLLDASYSKSQTYILPIINIIDRVGIHQLAIDNSAIMVKWIMVDNITKDQMIYYNFLVNKIKSGILTVPNPDNMDYHISLEILKSETKTECTYSDNTFYVTKKINLVTTIGEVQKPLTFTDEVLELLKNQLSQDIENKCTELFNKYKKENIDLIGVKDLCYKDFPYVDIDNILAQTILNVEVNVEIKGSTNLINF